MSIAKKSAPQTALERKISRIAADPIRYETRKPASVGFAIKAVRLG